MLEWLYRYIVRGIGVLFVIGLITLLFLWVNARSHRPSEERPASVHDRR